MIDERIQIMLDRYQCQTGQDYENSLKEIIQEIALLGLWRSNFFHKAAFYGGTALRILYGLDRFSEDMDFSLLSPQQNFEWDEFNQAVKTELLSFGMEVEVDNRIKVKATDVQSAFIKAGTKAQMLAIQVDEAIANKIHHQQLIKIKMEVDTNPPPDFTTEAKPLLLPMPFTVNTYSLSDLFAGKIHACLCRKWKNRIKGRDWYDLVWFVSKRVPVNLVHLKARLCQTENWQVDDALTLNALKQMFLDKIAQIDFSKAKLEVEPFLNDPLSVAVWSRDFFKRVVDQLVVVR